ncbi:MAG: YARHG domain-containing protein [Chryseobacterium sp.]|nr:YARHG domain-containing protein [Candidatus Chryseobacterium enterohippi]
MKIVKLAFVSLFAIALVSCKKEKPEKSTTNAPKDSVKVAETHQEYYGLYTGEFIGIENVYSEESEEYYDDVQTKHLTLKINRITNDSVYGQSITSGTQRPFRGIFNSTAKSFILDEPGDDKTDGRFEVKLKNDSLVGNWIAFKKTAVKIPTKKLKLIKKDFVYNPNFMLDENSELIDWSNPKDFIEKYTDNEGKTETYTSSKNRVASDGVFTINASKQKVTEKEVKNLRKLDLEIIKNSIFARHGYSFKKETYRDFFERTDWYIPISNNVDSELTSLEKENIVVLNRFIQYAEDKYDSFGR